ncbi:SOS response-associated peptidase [Roseovarius sp. EL26]|uniref:SOS response-associated peptidase n=1 Tax=Roseovarius sp. EL26 TaxID=2126672 RepID=UPI000EA2A167|nr:SOS response-associated peptidase family protein [Roseovarius sp. EL26]
MCGKFAAGHLTQCQMREILEGFLYANVSQDELAIESKQGYNISPSDQAHMVRWTEEGFELTSAQWQISDPRQQKPMINSKIEKPYFWKDYWDHGRCVIPALGYYEWSGITGRKHPYFITVNRNAPVVFFAGFYRTSDNRHQCSILTCKPSSQIEYIHNRMPVILSPSEIEDWLAYVTSKEDAKDTLGTSWDGRFQVTPVKPIKPGCDGPEMVEKWKPKQSSFDF